MDSERGSGRIRFLISSSPWNLSAASASFPTHGSGDFPGKLRGVGSAIRGGPGKRKTAWNTHVDVRRCDQHPTFSPNSFSPEIPPGYAQKDEEKWF